jgi:hypothetical protein
LPTWFSNLLTASTSELKFSVHTGRASGGDDIIMEPLTKEEERRLCMALLTKLVTSTTN